MNRTPDIELVLREWLAPDSDVAPDRILEVVADRIAAQPRRPAWRLQRRLPVNSSLKVLAGLAAALVVAVVVWQALPDIPGGKPDTSPSIQPPSPSPVATALPTGAPEATGPVALPEGPLRGGSYSMAPYMPGLSTIAVVADIPDGWWGHPGFGVITKPDEHTGVLVAGMLVDTLYSDACQWDLDGTGSSDQPGDVVIGPSVDDLVDALTANTSYTSSAPTPITIDGYEGQELELQLPGEDVLAACDRREGQEVGDYFVFSKGFYAQSPNSRWRLVILDVEGTRLVNLISIAPTASAEAIAEASQIVASFDITP